jgi:hypothetical protein
MTIKGQVLCLDVTIKGQVLCLDEAGLIEGQVLDAAAARELLRSRLPHPDLAPHPDLP